MRSSIGPEPTPPEPVPFVVFHRHELPGLVARNGALALADVQPVGALAIRTPAGSFTYVPTDDTIEIVEGEEPARTVVAMDEDAFDGLVHDLETTPGLFYGGRVEVVRGNPLRFVRWEPALRALFHGLPIYDPETIDLRDRHGGPLDPSRSFALDDLADRFDDVRDHFETAGYAHVRGVFTPDEVAGFLEDAAVLRDEAREGDQESWWGRTADGEAVLTRVLRAATRPRLRALYDDARVQRIASVPATPLVAKHTEGCDAVTVLWKIPNVREGLADLPWHRDCGMGGHARNCPAIVMTICLNDGSAAAGELRVLPGSHRASFPFVDGTDRAAPRGVSIGVTAGDVTIHATDVMHASLPPTSEVGPHRISVLLDFVSPGAGHHRGGRHYNDVLLGADDGQVAHLADRVGRG
ncbi:MAG: phytanoyl-CoA dioxygenase family protein [Acidimicrobiia bacterium]